MKRFFPGRVLICIISAILILAAGAFAILHHLTVFVSYTPNPCQETSAPLANPYRGFYHIRGYYLPLEDQTLEQTLSDHIQWDASYQLVQIQINLRSYRSGDIDENGLSQLNRIFAAWGEAHKQMIVRFLYDWDGNAAQSEPDNVEQILRHIEQVAPIVNAHADHIYILQGIFVGNCGEMHSTPYMDEPVMRRLLSRLSELITPSIFLSVRTPAQWRTATGYRQVPDPFPAFPTSQDTPSQILAGRLGLFNDGMLGSDIDVGTYGYTALSDSSPLTAKGTREEELQFQSALCRYVPNGGEVVLDNPYNDLPAAVSDLTRMNVSYLNAAHDGAVLDKWRAYTCHTDDCFDGCSGYDYIAARLGYRYVLQSSDVTKKNDKNTAELSVTLKNAGFSGSLKQFPMEITLQESDTGETFSFPLEGDLRLLWGGETGAYTCTLPLKELPEGHYSVYFSLKDPADQQQILLANNLQQTSLGYAAGTLTVEK